MTQYAYPDADTTVNNWTASTGSDRYAMIDDAHDVAASTADNTYITDGGNGGAIILSLSNPFSSVTTPSARTDHKVRVLWSDDSGSSAVTLNINLKDTDGSDVKNQDFSYEDTSEEMDGSPSFSIMTLSTSQANSIGAYNNLTLTLTATDGMGMGATTNIYQAYFECPDAAASSTTTNAPFLLFLDW